MPEIDLSGQVAIVSGASKGVGRTYALALAAAGAKVVALARTVKGNPDVPGSLAEVADYAQAQGHDLTVCGCDVLDDDAIAAAVAYTIGRFGGLDILVNNAVWGISQYALLDVPDAEWAGVFSANVRAPYVFIRETATHLIARGGGAIINITSGAAGKTALGSLAHGYPAYAISKAALERLTTYCAAEFASSNIAVNALSPGNVAYYTRGGTTPDLRFWGDPMVFLASERPLAGGLTGTICHTYHYGRSWGPPHLSLPTWDEKIRHILGEAGL